MDGDAAKLMKHDVIEEWAEHFVAGDENFDEDAWLVMAALLKLGGD